MQKPLSLTKRDCLRSGSGVVAGAGVASGAGALLPKSSPQSAFALSSSSALLAKPTPQYLCCFQFF